MQNLEIIDVENMAVINTMFRKAATYYILKNIKKSVLDNWKYMGFAEHCIATSHIFNFNDFKMRHSSTKGKILNLLEQLEISKTKKQNKNIVNEKQSLVTILYSK